MRSKTKEAFDDAKALEARWKELEKEQKEVYQVSEYILLSEIIDSELLQRFTPQFLLLRLRHSITAQDDASESLASAFVQQQSSTSTPSSNPGSGTGTPSGQDIDAFVKEFKDLRKVYHKRVIWGDRWNNGQVAWRDD